MVRFLISRPIAVIMVYIAILMLGIVSYRLLPISLMPDIDIPEITVQVSYPNSSARELENSIIKGLRAQLMQVAHLSDINSETRDGESTIRLSFDYGTPIDYAFIEVNEKTDAAMNYLPRDMKRPRVIKASATDLPVFYLNISLIDDSLKNSENGNAANYDKFLELSEFCENVISKRIEQLSQVAMIDMSGTINSEILIKPDKQKMESLNISFNQVQQAVNGSNISPGSIMVRDGYYEYYIRFTSYLKSPADIGNIFIRTNNKILQLKDIAEIIVRPQKPSGLFTTGNKQAITMAIIQQADARMADLKTEVNKLLSRFHEDYPGLQFEIAKDQSSLLDISISNLKQDLLMGGLMGFVILLLFLNDFRAPVLIAITVPVSLIISLLFFKLFHLSINIISLAGLALGLGMIIDCSIIVIENILHYYHHDAPLGEACIKGTTEVIRPMLTSTLTTSSVFLPLIFLSGMAGALFYDEAVSVSLGNGASFIVAITILPVLFMLFYTKRSSSAVDSSLKSKQTSRRNWEKGCGKGLVFLRKLSIAKPVERWYERGVGWVFRHKVLTTIIFFLTISSNSILFYVIKKEKLPALPQTELVVNIEWNENIHLNENQRRTGQLINQINHHLLQSNCLIGEQQFVLGREKGLDYFQSEMYLKMKGKEDVKIVEDTIRTLIRQHFPLAKISFQPPETIFERIFSNNEPSLVAKVSVNNAGQLAPDSILSFIARADARVNAVYPNRIPLQQQLVINIDLEKLLLYGVDYNTVSQSIKTAFNENQFATLRSSQRFMPIVLGEDSRMVSSVLASRKVQNNKREELPLSAFTKINREHDLKYIMAGQQGEYIPLKYEVSEKEAEKYKYLLREFVNEKQMPDVQFTGALANSNRLFKELGVILLVSVLLLYFILAAQFESLLQPFIVLLEIPANIAGAFFLLWLFNNSLNIMSGIGIIVGCGVFINDSIIKVDTINQLRKKGMPLMESIKQGGLLRIGGILMTAAITILAVVPFFFGNDIGSSLQKPLSLSLIGGMIVGTFVSLFFVPLVYWAIYRNRQ
ncbi:MAG: efflux RND transporter permease subunit [Bacteroidia bacterium]|nr:efflux RND transporter permease subunit [Bacteroidia bacterium]